MKDQNTPESPKKIGEGHAKAMLRQGFKELQSALYTHSNVAREPEPGTFGSPTQGEIAADRRPDAQASIMDRHTQDARSQSRESHERGREAPSVEPPEPERE